MSQPMTSKIFSWISGTTLLIGMPLLGVWLAGRPLAPYLEMPPRTQNAVHAAFSWPAFCGLAAFIILVMGLFLVRILTTSPSTRVRTEGVRRFPWWGWLALCSGTAAWVLAWTRFPWFSAFQPFTFTPLWLSYIAVMNALAVKRTGRSPLTHDTWRYLALFPMSAVFWWFFEYLNRFVQNWHYLGVEHLSAEAYVCRAMLPFATVLPAFVATRAWLAGYPRLTAGLTGWLTPVIRQPRRFAALILTLAAGSLAGIGLWPDILFPMVWLAPLMVIASLRALNGQSTLLSDPGRGDWRRIVQAATAALVCGFFWEMWNLPSLEKWIYTVPYVGRFHIFEMPVLGYAGYLPFGIECALITEWVGLTGKEESP